MYAHPEAKPAELREATLKLAKEVWNRYYAPVFGQKDCTLLGIYSHMIHSFLYLPDYPLGHLIAFQIEEHMEHSGKLGAEFERMSRQGRLTPDLWMVQATGAPVSSGPLLRATEKALVEIAR
jgi:oligoendopeptidase F